MVYLKKIKLNNLFLSLLGLALISTFSTSCGSTGTGVAGELDVDDADYEAYGNVGVDYDDTGTATDAGTDGADGVDTGGGDVDGSLNPEAPADPFDIPITIAKSEKPDYTKVAVSYEGNKMTVSCTAGCISGEYDTVVLYINGTAYYISVNPDGSFSATFEMQKITLEGSTKVTIAIAVYDPDDDVAGIPVIVEVNKQTGGITFYNYDGTLLGLSSIEFSKDDSLRNDDLKTKTLPTKPDITDFSPQRELDGKTIDDEKNQDKFDSLLYKNPTEEVILKEPYSPAGVQTDPEIKTDKGTKVLEPKTFPLKADVIKTENKQTMTKKGAVKVENLNADTLLVHFTEADKKQAVEVKTEQLVGGQITAVEWKSETELEVTVQKKIGSVTQTSKVIINPTKGS